MTLIKDIFEFGKGRAIITVYSIILTFVFVDVFKFKYWQFEIFFWPLSFIVSFFITRQFLERKTPLITNGEGHFDTPCSNRVFRK